MEEEEQQLLEFISNYFKAQFNSKSIKDIKWDAFREGPIGEVADFDEYDNISVSDFLILYKINRLKELNIITCEKENYLMNLFNYKLILEDRLGEILAKEAREGGLDNSEELYKKEKNAIYEKWSVIDDELRKYHLDGNFDFKKIIDGFISMENYPEMGKSYRK